MFHNDRCNVSFLLKHVLIIHGWPVVTKSLITKSSFTIIINDYIYRIYENYP